MWRDGHLQLRPVARDDEVVDEAVALGDAVRQVLLVDLVWERRTAGVRSRSGGG